MRAGIALAACVLALGCGAAAPPPPRHLLLISIDTLRADHLGLYGYGRPTSPNLDALAAESVVFENAWSTAPWTLPAHASLLTGLYPSRHGAREQRRKLGAGVETLAERLGAAGFANGAVVNVTFLTRRYGFARGFAFHKRVLEAMKPSGAAGQVSRHGLDWLREQGERRSFLFLHYFDLHSDYTSQPRFERMFTAGGRFEGRTAELSALIHGDEQAKDSDVAHLVGLYDAGIRQLDEELGRVFAALRALGRWDDTLLVVTADHGEEFADHGLFSHGFTHYEEMLRVPLLVRWPGADARRVTTPVSAVDVVPTLLTILGLNVPEGLDGRDLTPLWRGHSLPVRAIFAESGPAMRDELRSAREADFKLILHPDRNQLNLFDLGADPEERQDVSAQHPEMTRRLEAALLALDAMAAPPGESLDLPPEVVDRLRALGYDAGTAP